MIVEPHGQFQEMPEERGSDIQDDVLPHLVGGDDMAQCEKEVTGQDEDQKEDQRVQR